MEERIRRIYLPMTETGFYILFCLQTPKYRYGIGQQVKKMTGNAVSISPGKKMMVKSSKMMNQKRYDSTCNQHSYTPYSCYFLPMCDTKLGKCYGVLGAPEKISGIVLTILIALYLILYCVLKKKYDNTIFNLIV